MRYASGGGTNQVDSGALLFGGNAELTNTTFQVAPGARIVLTNLGNDVAVSGTLAGSGGGTVEMDDLNANLRAVGTGSLNFPEGMLQLKRGHVGFGAANFVNQGFVSMSTATAGDFELNFNGLFHNEGVLLHTTTNKLALGFDTLPFDNRPGGVYRFLADGEVRGGGRFRSM